MIERDLAYRNTFGNPPSNYLKMINYALQEGQSFPDLRDDNFHNLLIKKLEQQFEQTGKKPLLVLDNLRSLSSYKENDSDDFNKINKFFLRLKAFQHLERIRLKRNQNTLVVFWTVLSTLPFHHQSN